jgi:hypothetical protein
VVKRAQRAAKVSTEVETHKLKGSYMSIEETQARQANIPHLRVNRHPRRWPGWIKAIDFGSHWYNGAHWIDHVGIDNEGNFISESYAQAEDVRPALEELRQRYGVEYEISDIAWHNEECIRITIKPGLLTKMRRRSAR